MCQRNFIKVEGKNLSLEQFKYILDQLPSLKHITLVGSGETLMAPDLYKMLNLGKSRNIRFTIITNGTLLNEENIKKLINVDEVVVSIDSPIPEKYKKIRGGDLNGVINNLKRLKQLKKEICLRLQAIIMEDNIEDLSKFITLAENINADEIKLLSLRAYNPELDRKYGDNFKNLKAKLKEVEGLAKEKRIKFQATPLLTKPRECLYPWTSLRIFLNGDCYPCLYAYSTHTQVILKEYYQGLCLGFPQFQYKMGNIFENSFQKIWNGKDYRLLRKIVKESNSNILLSPEELNQRRKEVNLEEKFSYCRVCLWRQNRAS
jgi:MoaA/NifB/PqqE/SkfB family radical SAM enzyme